MTFRFVIANLYLLILLLSSISTILISRKNQFAFHLQSFAYLTGVTFVNECVALYIAPRYLGGNWGTYNYFVLVETLWHMYFFYSIFRQTGTRKLVVVLAILFSAFWLYTNLFVVHFFQSNHYIWNSYNIIAASILTVLLSCLYLYQLIEIETPHEIHQRAEFWIVVTMLVYYVCQIPYFGVYNLIVEKKYTMKQLGFGNLMMIMLLLNCIMYALFIYAYVCQKRLLKSRQSN